MKRILSILAIAVIALVTFNIQTVNAQDPIWSEDFSSVTTGGTQQCGASGSVINQSNWSTDLPQWDYSASFKVYPSVGKVKLGTGSDAGYIQTLPIDLSEYGSVIISFDAKAWNVNNNPNAGTTLTVTVGSTDYAVEGLPNLGTTDTTTPGFCDMGHFEILAAAGSVMAIRFTGDTRAFIDNVAIYPATAPTISVIGNHEFSNVGVNDPQSTILTVKGYNLDANGTTSFTLTGDSQFTTTATSPIANSTLLTETGISIPVAFSADAAGEYAATLTFTNSEIANPVTVNLTATVIEITEVPAIDQLHNLIDLSNVDTNFTGTDFYKYTGSAYITQIFNDGRKWIQDETGAILLYDPNNIISGVAVGVAISNFSGHLTNYYGYAEMNVVECEYSINAFPTYVPQPISVSFEQLNDNQYMNDIQGQLIKLENVSFTTTGSAVKMMRYAVSANGTTDTAVYTTSASDNFTGMTIPTGTGNIIGVNYLTNAYSNGSGSPRLGYSRYYILPRDFEGFNVSINENEMNSLNVFPNPTSSDVVLSINAPATHVVIYNMVGELVDSQAINAGSNTVKMNNLTNGVYFLRVFNGNELVGTSKVVRN